MFAVEERPGRGRCAVASEPLRRGDVVLRDEGTVLPVLVRDHWRSHCWGCLHPLPAESAARCARCKTAWFCGRTCQRAAWKSHKPECNAALTALASGADAEIACNAVLLARVLVAAGNEQLDILQDRPGSPSDASVAALACALVNQPGQSARAAQLLRKFDRNNFGVVDDLYIVVAAGVYPRGAILNHACAPNCVLFYRREPGRVVQEIRCIVDAIAPGTELVHAYCDAVEPTAVRQQSLQVTYGFSCSCALCNLPAAQEAARAGLAERIEYLGGELSAALQSEDVSKALESSRALLGAYELAYASCPYHPLIGLQLFTLADLVSMQEVERDGQGNLSSSTRQLYERAKDTLATSCGADSNLVKKLNAKLA